MPVPVIAIVAAAAAAGVALALNANDSGAIKLGTPQAFPPVAEPPPPREPVPELTWHDAGGDIRIEAMARSPRFPAEPPGDTRFVLATVADLAGKRGKSFRIVCDAYVEDTNDTASLVMLARSIKRAVQSGQKDRPDIMPAFHHTAWGERLVRRFTLQHGQAIPVAGSLGTKQLPTQLPTTPAVPRYQGHDCNTVEKNPSDWDDVLAGWGIGDQRAFYLFDTDACGENGWAYKDRGSPSYPGLYNLRLEGDGSRVVLTAEVARLPLVQLLSWRAYYGVR
jgi:hypothetical protein